MPQLLGMVSKNQYLTKKSINHLQLDTFHVTRDTFLDHLSGCYQHTCFSTDLARSCDVIVLGVILSKAKENRLDENEAKEDVEGYKPEEVFTLTLKNMRTQVIKPMSRLKKY